MRREGISPSSPDGERNEKLVRVRVSCQFIESIEPKIKNKKKCERASATVSKDRSPIAKLNEWVELLEPLVLYYNTSWTTIHQIIPYGPIKICFRDLKFFFIISSHFFANI